MVVKIITDSTSDLSSDIRKRYDISIVPLYVYFREDGYKDGENLVPKQLFALVKEQGILPKTAAPAPFDFANTFSEWIDRGQDIVVLTISSKMSSSYQNAVLAASEFPEGRIWVVDSENITTGIGLLATIAGDLAQEGKSAQEIAETLQGLIPKVRVNFVIDTLEYLYKGGRCNVVENMVGTLLKIKPVIGVENGSMFVAEKIRGDKKRALDKMIKEVINNPSKVDYHKFFIVNSCGSEDESDYVKSCLQNVFEGIEIMQTQAGCVISSHCGEKTLGISYIEK